MDLCLLGTELYLLIHLHSRAQFMHSDCSEAWIRPWSMGTRSCCCEHVLSVTSHVQKYVWKFLPCSQLSQLVIHLLRVNKQKCLMHVKNSKINNFIIFLKKEQKSGSGSFFQVVKSKLRILQLKVQVQLCNTLTSVNSLLRWNLKNQRTITRQKHNWKKMGY